jgi:O-antigen biosynthesis protein
VDAVPDISVVVVSYNVKSYLESALSSIRTALAGLTSEVFVVDNASIDGSAAMVRSLFPEVRLVANPTNVGFARANNQALAQASGRAVCLINPDTLVREDTLRTCLAHLRAHPDIGAVGCKILNPDGTLQLACRRSFPTPWVAFTKIAGLAALFPKSRTFGRYNLTYLDPDAEADVEAISGSFMMVRREAVGAAGLLDESFFLYGEDLDWCYRIHRRGWRIVYLPSTQIVHYKGRSAREAPFDTSRVFYDAMHLFVKKHFRRGWSFLPMWFLRAGIWARRGLAFGLHVASRLAVPLVDAVFLQACLAAALLIRFGSLAHWASYSVVDAVYATVWIACVYLTGGYRKGVFSSSKAAGASLLGMVLNASLTFFLPQYAFSRKVVVIWGALTAVSLSGWRLAIRLAARFPRFPFLGTIGKTLLRRRAVIVGTGEASVRLFERMRLRIDSGFDAAGLVALVESDPAPDGVPCLGSLCDLGRISRTHRIHTVIFTQESAHVEAIVGTIAAGNTAGLEFKMVPGDLDMLIGRSSVDSLDDVPLVDLDYPLFRVPNRVFKRCVDAAAAAALSPAWLGTIGLALLRGYRFRRAELQGWPAGTLRIRELWRNGQPARGWLAAAPRFREVLLGRFSLVGLDARPAGPAMTFKPGVTGLVQVHAGKGLGESERERYRRYYLKNYSFLLDLEILFKAVFKA